MPSVENPTGDDYNLPSLGGLVVPAHSTVDCSDEAAAELDGHPILHVVIPSASRPPAVPPAEPAAVTVPAEPGEGA